MECNDDSELFEEMCNIARVLPNIAASTIYSELNKLRNDSNRVKLILKKYFTSYEPQEHNCMSDDIKKIKRVLPDYPFIHINNDLLAVEDKENRVQLVLKKYFDNQVKAAKRSLQLDNIDSTELSSSKKFKSNVDTDTHSEINSEQVDNSVEIEHSSNETETESYTAPEEFQLAKDQFDQDLGSNNGDGENCNIVLEINNESIQFENPVLVNTNEQNSNVSKETIVDQCEESTRKIKIVNYFSLDEDNQNLNSSEETIDNQCEIKCEIKTNSDNQKVNNKNEKTSLISILSTLFPQHSSYIFTFICDDLNIDLYDAADESTVERVVNRLISYSSTKEYDTDEFKITNQQNSATACVESSMAGTTDDFEADDLEYFFRNTVENIVSNIGDNNKETTVQTCSISTEPVVTAYSPSKCTVEDISNLNYDSNSSMPDQNAVLNELQIFLNGASVDLNSVIPQLCPNPETNQLTEPTACTSQFDNNPVSSTSTSVPSTVKNIPESSTVVGSVDIQSRSDVLNHIIKTLHSKPETNRHSDTLNFESALLNNVFPELCAPINMASSAGTSRTANTPARPTPLIKPASFHLKRSTVTTSRSKTGGNFASNSILKPATFQPRTNKIAPELTYRSLLAAGNTTMNAKTCTTPSVSSTVANSNHTTSSRSGLKSTIKINSNILKNSTKINASSDDLQHNQNLNLHEISLTTTKKTASSKITASLNNSFKITNNSAKPLRKINEEVIRNQNPSTSSKTKDSTKLLTKTSTKTCSTTKLISRTSSKNNINATQVKTNTLANTTAGSRTSNNKTVISKHKNFVQGLKKEYPKINHPIPSTSGLTHSFASKNQDINKNTIRVRTDLYDTYFNGPVLQSSISSIKTRNACKREEIDDIIFVSEDRLPQKTTNIKITKAANVHLPQDIDPINLTPIIDPVLKSTKVQNIKEKPVLTNIDITQPSTSKANENHPFYFKLLEIFPDICPDYLKRLCAKNTGNQTLDDLISVLLNGDYTRRDRIASPELRLDFEEQNKILQDLFPDADPTYLQHHCERLIDQPDNFKKFVASLFENNDYPTKDEYLKKMKLSAQEKQYTTEFDVKKFLEVIPNPEEFFTDPKRQVSFINFDDTNYAVTFLKNTYSTTAIKDITVIFRKHNFSILGCANELETIQNLKTKRKPYPVTSCKNIPLLQEIAYVKHKKQILEYIKEQELEKTLAREQAKAAGLMKTCQCCYDDEIMPDDTATCECGLHIFCKDCIRKGCEIQIGDGKLDFPCLETCESFFTLQILQSVLTPKVFSKMAQRKQMAEVKSAGIEDLEFCPFCDFAAIPAPGDKVFRCLNSDCMKESCRLCKEPSHIPLRCDELEKDKDVKMRTYIEDKMTEALLRKCWKCGLKFIKESGCNKMTCSCGAMMCYVCNQPVKDYKHFNGQGGDQTHLCPLYSDTHKLHMDAIKRGAESAKKELGVNKENQLKIDPTMDLEQHYISLAAQNPTIPNIPDIYPNNILPQ